MKKKLTILFIIGISTILTSLCITKYHYYSETKKVNDFFSANNSKDFGTTTFN